MLRVVCVLAVAAQVLCVPLLSQSGVLINVPPPMRVASTPTDWVAATPLTHPLIQTLLEEEEGTKMEPSAPSALSCSMEKGCTCQHQYFSNHLESKDCEVFVPEEYYKGDFRCQYFVQGGYIFLYGDSWKKNPSANGHFFCSE
eukprot:c38761_g1_i1.p1 GENE.c38761_g1_i1~~c38761_g1_i1.p1  ORF type:complete len:156 (+),score=26.12 c38761_g1_i1:40-468(+)